ncbi:unnamed protein product, partial [Iphiclides podalirius]
MLCSPDSSKRLSIRGRSRASLLLGSLIWFLKIRLPQTRNGCRGGGRGTKEPLLIDAVIGKMVKRNRRNFSAAWTDYKKAFDSVPHTWLKRVLELYKASLNI